MMSIFLGVLIAGCATDADVDLSSVVEEVPVEEVFDEHQSPCGEVSTFDLVLNGWVINEAGSPVGGAMLQLEERVWEPGHVHASVQTDEDGMFELSATGLTSVADCWGSALQYWIFGETSDMAGDLPVNTVIVEGMLGANSDAEMVTPLILKWR